MRIFHFNRIIFKFSSSHFTGAYLQCYCWWKEISFGEKVTRTLYTFQMLLNIYEANIFNCNLYIYIHPLYYIMLVSFYCLCYYYAMKYISVCEQNNADIYRFFPCCVMTCYDRSITNPFVRQSDFPHAAIHRQQSDVLFTHFEIIWIFHTQSFHLKYDERQRFPKQKSRMCPLRISSDF